MRHFGKIFLTSLIAFYAMLKCGVWLFNQVNENRDTIREAFLLSITWVSDHFVFVISLFLATCCSLAAVTESTTEEQSSAL